MLIVGAGLAGLAAALRLTAAGRSVRVLEASDAPGGRMRSDRVDGFTVDRGFQVMNTAYSEAARFGLLDGLAVGRFDRGALLRTGTALTPVADPRRVPAGTVGLLFGVLGTLPERVRLGAFLAEAASLPPRRRSPDVALIARLRRRGIAGAPTDRFLRPFLQGVLLEAELSTSSRFAEYVLRTFARGDVVVPQGGMGAIPPTLAARLPAGTIEYGAHVVAVRPGEVDVAEAGTLRAEAVIVAADPVTAAALLGLPAPAMHAVTTVWHAVDAPPTRRPMIALPTTHGPLANSVVMTNAAPDYSGDGRALIASSTLRADPLPDAVLRRELAHLWGVGTARWAEVAVTRVPQALPALPGGAPLRKPVRLANGLLVAGDHRATPSIQGALESGRRAADALLLAP